MSLRSQWKRKPKPWRLPRQPDYCSWLHCGYHLTTSIVSPSLLCLPSVLALLGWVGGLVSMILVDFVSFYAYNLLSLVLEYHAQLGKPQLGYRDMAADILGWFI
ncbi:Amino acid transporter, transmembrane domain containing protein [Trema orientale]|uniref:Amino acid transporter, transmembrane domain containing protein n=1 Tax=Trema orientale TaxID=63057 RepID=A0A2P5C013_TREOI|nr:Amino acid transporter, transmembrane domain containing protein [Trema orientale]